MATVSWAMSEQTNSDTAWDLMSSNLIGVGDPAPDVRYRSRNTLGVEIESGLFDLFKRQLFLLKAPEDENWELVYFVDNPRPVMPHQTITRKLVSIQLVPDKKQSMAMAESMVFMDSVS